MSLQYLSYALPLLAAAVLAAYLAILSWKQEGVLGRGTFGWLMVAVLIWTFTSAVEKLLVGVPAKILCSQAQYLGICATPPLWLLTALRFSRQERWFRPGTLWILWIIPILTFLLAATNSLHHSVWSEVTLGSGKMAGIGIYGHGPWFWVAATYNYLLFFAGSLLLWRTVLVLPHIFRRQSLVLLLAASLPGLANAAYLTNLSPLPGLDLTPFAFSVSGLGLAWSVLRLRMLDLRPIARDTLVEHLRDGVVVVDPEGRVVDVNPAARRILGISMDVVGRPIGPLLPAFRERLDDDEIEDAAWEFTLRQEPLQVVEVNSIPLLERGDRLAGRLLVLRDVTERKQLDVSRREANQRLQDQLAEIRLLQAELHERAVRDALTGLYNRRYLEELLSSELAEPAPGWQVAVVMVDIDSFKQLNDTYGHAVGDRVMQCLADVIGSNATPNEHACRYGGEEFVVVLTGASAGQAVARAEQWRRIFSQRAYPNATLSAGVAVFPEHARDMNGLLRAADHALYAAKAKGRNQVCLAAGGPVSRS